MWGSPLSCRLIHLLHRREQDCWWQTRGQPYLSPSRPCCTIQAAPCPAWRFLQLLLLALCKIQPSLLLQVPAFIVYLFFFFFLLATILFCFCSWMEDLEISVSSFSPLFCQLPSANPRGNLLAMCCASQQALEGNSIIFLLISLTARKNKVEWNIAFIDTKGNTHSWKGLIDWLWASGNYTPNKRNLETMSFISLTQPYLAICELCSILLVLARHGAGGALPWPAVLRVTA